MVDGITMDTEVYDYEFRGTIGIPMVDIESKPDKNVEKVEYFWHK